MCLIIFNEINQDYYYISFKIHLADLTNLLALGSAIQCIINSILPGSILFYILFNLELKIMFYELEQSSIASTGLSNIFYIEYE
jgi:putative effector of murein hydrolase LrgA (UPF0299 family)